MQRNFDPMRRQVEARKGTRLPDEAAKLIRIGDRKTDPALPPAEIAAATILAQTVLNLDATVWKR